MSHENEFYRKVYDHHEVLKGETSSALLESMQKAGFTRDAITNVVNITNATIDSSSHKMVSDFQRAFERMVMEENK